MTRGTGSSPRTTIQRHSRTRISLGALMVVCAVACGTPYSAVHKIKNATVPSADQVPPLGDPVQEEMSLRFVWELDSHLPDDQYLEWVVGALTHDGFVLQQRASASVAANRMDGGDVFRLNIQVVSRLPTHISATLVIAPG